jgi:hypothetical protein
VTDTSSMFQQHSGDVPRDRYGRYLLPDESGDNTGWTRATTFAATLAEAHGLRIYEQRQVVLGMGRRPDLVTLASTIAGPEDKKALGAIVDSAHEAAGTQAKANRGTAVHKAIQVVEQAADRDAAIAATPAELRGDVIGYFRAIDDAKITISPALIERVVIVPQYRVAGTPDNYVICPDGKWRVLDKKTGNLDYASIEFAVQLALYANAKALRNYGTNSYEPLPEIATDYAIIAHVVPGTGRTELMRVNIAWGWAWARTCAEVMDIRKTKNVITPYIPDAPMPPMQQAPKTDNTVIRATLTPERRPIETEQSVSTDAQIVNAGWYGTSALDPADFNAIQQQDTSAFFLSVFEEDEDPSAAGAAVPATASAAPAPVASPAVAPAADASAPTIQDAGAAGSDAPPLVIDDPDAAAQALVDGAKGKAKLQQLAKDFAAEITQRTGAVVEFKLNQHQIKLARDMVAAATTHNVTLPDIAPSARGKASAPVTEDEKRLTTQLEQIRLMPTVEGLTQYQANIGERWTDEHQQAARVRVEEINAAAEQAQTGLTVEQIIAGATSTQTIQLAWRKATNNGTDASGWTPEREQMAATKVAELTAGQTPQQ